MDPEGVVGVAAAGFCEASEAPLVSLLYNDRFLLAIDAGKVLLWLRGIGAREVVPGLGKLIARSNTV